MAESAGVGTDESAVLKTLANRPEEITGLLKALAHPARLLMVAALVHGEYSVGGLEERLGVHQPSLSQQLGVLRSAGIVETRREAKQVFYSLADQKAALLIQALAEIYFES
ncbi:MAG: metalloregulator ArsR/SmtB family transcription factor [Rhizobiaceae bacterium]|nr:metalloregulator ArsR/SmtB family transcription factor [Rhizobiaceae bacterium]